MNDTSQILDSALSYRVPMAVTSIRGFRTLTGGLSTYPVCPRCHTTMEHEYQAYCDRCGQALDWKDIKRANIIIF